MSNKKKAKDMLKDIDLEAIRRELPTEEAPMQPAPPPTPAVQTAGSDVPAVAAKKKDSLQRDIAFLAGILFLICAVVAGILGLVNDITKDRIAAIGAEKIAAAMESIVPGGEFKEITDFKGADPIIRAVYAAYVNGEAVGLCIEVAPQGFGGEITTIVGVDLEGRILGVDITKMSETGGLGSKATDPQWLAQYSGKSGTLNVIKNGTPGEGDIVAISASTITSRAVTTGVQAAMDFASSYIAGGGLS